MAVNSDNPDARTAGQHDQALQEIAMLHEQLRINDARWERIPPHRRPFFTPVERMAINELRALRGWN
ncbi:MAG: hypothetical protein HY343_01530, partial [Lentisphaerae bacterium]|nr:hypothetical protein [Lentisphaerota bacterium]